MYDVGKLRHMFQEGRVVIGGCCRSMDPFITEMMANIGYEAFWIENEHSALDKKETLMHIMAAQAAGAAAIVRVPWNDPVLVKPILELGVDGIVFPMIRSAEEARKAVAACTYPPHGVRGMGPIRSNNYGLVDYPEFISRADEQVFKIMQIEHIDGVNNIEEILDVEGVDGIVIGQFDLSGSLGILGQVDDPRNVECIEKVCEACRRKKMIFGAMTGDPKGWQKYIDRGASFLFTMYEYDWIREAATKGLADIKEIVKKAGKKA